MIDWLAANAPLLRNISVLALLGYSVQLALRAGVFSFATVGFYAIGGYVTANLLKAGWNWVAVMALVIVVGFVFALVISPVLNRLRHLFLAMATLAFTLFIQSLALSWATFTGGAQGMFGVRRVLPQGAMIAIVVVVVLIVWLTQRGVLGRATSALRHDELLAASLGVNVSRQQTMAFAASSGVGALAGFVQVSTTGVFGPDDISFSTVVTSLTVLVVGGAIIWAGPLVGAILVGTLPLYLVKAGNLSLIIQAVVVLAIVVYQPEGLVGIVKYLFSIIRKPFRKKPRETTAGAPAS
ncbi:MAG: branched-chain amino acid transporter permease [Subtercola sp.]|nr:branched-chain amino acid transporter permease [Subtercola sp.]